MGDEWSGGNRGGTHGYWCDGEWSCVVGGQGAKGCIMLGMVLGVGEGGGGNGGNHGHWCVMVMMAMGNGGGGGGEFPEW